MATLTDDIKREALRLGFDKIGVTPAAALGEEANRLREWLAQGYHGTMSWMERTGEKRSDPRAVYPDARSVVCVAMNYYTALRYSDEPGTGRISRYAWGEDYHRILTARLEELLASIKRLSPGADGRVYVDTGPLMEKVLAQRAGLGWEGKHTNLITREVGSWVFLGEILLNLELEYDAPATDHCGSCTRCIEACPTDAIVAPYVLDSSKCISYLTIEHRGEIDPKLGAEFDSWIFGCDICQDVCPWNQRFSKESAIPEFRPLPGNLAPRLDEIRALSEKEFRARYRSSPVKRAKHAGMVRNASL